MRIPSDLNDLLDKQLRQAVEKLWKSCGKAMEKLWKSCGKAAEKLQGDHERSSASKTFHTLIKCREFLEGRLKARLRKCMISKR